MWIFTCLPRKVCQRQNFVNQGRIARDSSNALRRRNPCANRAAHGPRSRLPNTRILSGGARTQPVPGQPGAPDPKRSCQRVRGFRAVRPGLPVSPQRRVHRTYLRGRVVAAVESAVSRALSSCTRNSLFVMASFAVTSRKAWRVAEAFREVDEFSGRYDLWKLETSTQMRLISIETLGRWQPCGRPTR